MPEEPVLAIDNIQGNVAGFNKDHQRLLFFRIDDPTAFRTALRELIPSIATVNEVLRFNRLFKEIRRRRGRECPTVQATWINVAFSFQALGKLAPPRLGQFADEAFRQGMGLDAGGASRAVSVLGDPATPGTPGHPSTWAVGGTPETRPDVLVIVAGGDPGDVSDEADWVKRALAGATLVHEDVGETLPSDLRGHEHFGFLDGVSQPGVRGRLSADPTDVYMPRQNPNDPNQGKPGQDLIWPGEFVFGYPRQNPSDLLKAGPDSMRRDGSEAPAAPYWAADGSFLVYRRLRQRVGAFHTFVHQTAGARGLTPEQLGSKLVGRWPSGAPTERTPGSDALELGNDDCANNNFEFQDDAEAILHARGGQCLDRRFPPADGDPQGSKCPWGGHIRKAYPRDDVSSSGKALRASNKTSPASSNRSSRRRGR